MSFFSRLFVSFSSRLIFSEDFNFNFENKELDLESETNEASELDEEGMEEEIEETVETSEEEETEEGVEMEEGEEKEEITKIEEIEETEEGTSKEDREEIRKTKQPNPKHLRRQIFGFGTMLLNKAGQTDQESRKIIGKWLKTNKETEILNLIKQASIENILDPVSWITKQLEKQNILFQEQKRKEIQNKYNSRKEELEEEYQRTHNREYNESKIQNCLLQSDDPHKNKIFNSILKPTFHYYGAYCDEDIANLFCEALSRYNYDIIAKVRDELLAKYKTFPKLPEWIARCEEKTQPDKIKNSATDNTQNNKTNSNNSSNNKTNSSDSSNNKTNSNNTSNNIKENNQNNLTNNKELQKLINQNNEQNKNWLYVKQRCEEEMGKNIFSCWISNLNLLRETSNGAILCTDNGFLRDYVNRNYLNGTKVKLSSGDLRWLRRGITEFWKETNQNIETVEIKTIREIEEEIKNGKFRVENKVEGENQTKNEEEVKIENQSVENQADENNSDKDNTNNNSGPDNKNNTNNADNQNNSDSKDNLNNISNLNDKDNPNNQNNQDNQNGGRND
jgi:hypothetical protein